MISWAINKSNINQNKFKRYQKNHREDTATVFVHLENLLDFLNSGISFNQAIDRWPFLKSEKKQVYRISNKKRPNAHETRLYICVEEDQKLIYLLELGDKNSQSLDIKNSHEKANKILA